MHESVRARLATVREIERVHGPRCVPYLLDVLDDQYEPAPVRIHVLRRLRNGRFLAEFRPAIAAAILPLLLEVRLTDLRLQALLSLADFTDIDTVLLSLGRVALDAGEPIDIRYIAFTSLQRAGPTAECVGFLRQLATDEALGDSAQSVLSLWGQTPRRPDGLEHRT
ncbi:MAG TPA: hypothetical protein VGJ60_12415 [Chloroflexota bacterium]|jgi:hypothetical protein